MTMAEYGFRESLLERYLRAHPGAFLDDDDAITLGRQVSLPHGRVDLMIYAGSVYILELKAVALTPKDVCQVLRYQRDVRDLLWNMSRRDISRSAVRSRYAGVAGETFDHEYQKALLGKSDTLIEPVTVPVLIGPQSDESVVSAMMAIGGRVFVCRYDGAGGFSFREDYGRISAFDPDYFPGDQDWIIRYRALAEKAAAKEADIEQGLLVYRLFGEIALERGKDAD